MKKITCFCEKSFEKDISDEYDLDKQPEILDEIHEGSFMSVTCPECNTVLKPEFPFKIFKKSEQIDIFFIPELDRTNFYLKKTDYTIPESERIVIGYKELVEKLSIFGSKLDDQITEFLKYQIISKFLDSEDNSDNIEIFFKELKEDNLYFYIENLKPDEIGIFKLPVKLYNNADIKNKLNTEPYSDFLTPPYVSINNLFRENSL